MLISNRRGNSIIEIMVMIVVLSAGIVGAYNIVNSGQKLSTEASNRMKAINIAREGLEWVENIRDTNWIKFSSDYTNCWKVKDYNPLCIGQLTPGSHDMPAGSYVLVQNGTTMWSLSGTIVPSATYATYITQFPVFLDSRGLTTNSGSTLTKCSSSQSTNCRTMFTREIQISHPDADHLKVNSIVRWVDIARLKGAPYTINLETTLTNWKRKL